MNSMPKHGEIAALVDSIIEEYKTNPVDLLGRNDAVGEADYLRLLRDSYVRTVADITAIVSKPMIAPPQILEIGCFLGVVSVALSWLGMRVTAIDLPEYIDCSRLQELLAKNKIAYKGCNLRDYCLPVENGQFDVVLMCETLEHLNFNPLPICREINRVLRRDGLFYVSCPNIARIDNRYKLLRGESFLPTMEEFSQQLSSVGNKIVGLHWKEYAAYELRDLLAMSQFRVVDSRYVEFDFRARQAGIKKLLKKTLHGLLMLPPLRKVLYACLFDPDDPSLRAGNVVVGAKQNDWNPDFHFTDATKTS